MSYRCKIIHGVAVVAAVILLAPAPAVADGRADAFVDENEQAFKTEIKDRCIDSLGKYGEALVLECMKQDWAALQRVMDIGVEHPGIGNRCMDRLRDYGFSMVLECIKQDVEASDKIDDW